MAETQVRKCTVPWKIGVTGDGLHCMEPRVMRVKKWGGAETEKGLDR